MEVKLLIKARMAAAGVEPVEAEKAQITNATISGHDYGGYVIESVNDFHAIQSWTQSSEYALSAATRTNKKLTLYKLQGWTKRLFPDSENVRSTIVFSDCNRCIKRNCFTSQSQNQGRAF